MYDGSLLQLLERQRGVLSRAQALHHLSPDALRARLRFQWQRVLPGVYATFDGELSPAQRRWAAVLYAGATAQLTDVAVLEHHGVRYVPTDDVVHVLVDWSVRRRSLGFASVSRTRYLSPPHRVNGLPMCDLARALVDFALRIQDERTSIAVWADAVQRRLVEVGRLTECTSRAARSGRATPHRALEAIEDGVRSAPEADFRRIALQARGVPKPLFNALLRLPSGRHVSPDALVLSAGLVHETNGREYHGGGDEFASMQERHDAMTTAGLTLLHNAPRRLLALEALVRQEWEQCYRRLAGAGLPPGVELVRAGPTADPIRLPYPPAPRCATDGTARPIGAPPTG